MAKLLPTIILAILDACPAAVQEPDNSAYSPLLVAFDRLGRFDRFGRGDDGDLEGK